MSSLLPKRWFPLSPIKEQLQAYNGKHRFNTLPCGRRSGKTEIIGKRRLIRRAMKGSKYPNPKFFAGAPTRDQAKRIYWADLKEMIHPDWRKGEPSEGELVIRLRNGSDIHVIGLDRPERIEGVGWDGGVLDEYANMKPQVWESHIRPALSDKLGWCDFIGVPEGRNHYYELHLRAMAEMEEKGEDSEWGAYSWTSSLVLPKEEVEAAKSSMDPLTFAQEYEASFVNFAGQAYYTYSQDNVESVQYDATQPLIFCFDFNVSPSVAVICQELEFEDGTEGTAVIGEVYIPRNGNTVAVCSKLIEDYGDHENVVMCYGDATGASSGTAQVAGSDWDIIERELRGVFGGRLYMRVPRSNPRERVRVNAVNTRCCDAEGNVSLRVNPYLAPNLHKDLEGVRVLEGGSGQIDKKNDPKLTHCSDAFGYYIVAEFPVDAEDRVSAFSMESVI
jgi:hypothetical protein